MQECRGTANEPRGQARTMAAAAYCAPGLPSWGFEPSPTKRLQLLNALLSECCCPCGRARKKAAIPLRHK
eukprot:12473622-Alexandrium_andersonii.AAC.1